MSKISELINGIAVERPLRTAQEHFSYPKSSKEINQEIDRPSHYGSKSGQDVIDVAEDFGIIENAYKFNMLKYLLRGGKKKDNSELQDMKKIQVYLNRYIEKLETEQ